MRARHRLRELCGDTVIHMPWIRQTASPIVIANGSNAVDVVHPGIDGFDVGIRIQTGARLITTSTRIWGVCAERPVRNRR